MKVMALTRPRKSPFPTNICHSSSGVAKLRAMIPSVVELSRTVFLNMLPVAKDETIGLIGSKALESKFELCFVRVADTAKSKTK